MPETTKGTNKNLKESRFLIRAYQEACAELQISSFNYGSPQINLGIGLYDLLISSKSFLSDFESPSKACLQEA